MNKKVSVEESSNIFDLTALKLLISVVAISLAGMMSRASTMPKNLFNPTLTVSANAKADFLSCPIPYRMEYCFKNKTKNSCEYQGVGFLQSLKLAPFTKTSTKPFCSTNKTAIERSKS